jgi:hypothetical protein
VTEGLHGCNPNRSNLDGNNSIAIARQSGKLHIADYLEQHTNENKLFKVF